jgi:hypothetical protein
LYLQSKLVVAAPELAVVVIAVVIVVAAVVVIVAVVVATFPAGQSYLLLSGQTPPS